MTHVSFRVCFGQKATGVFITESDLIFGMETGKEKGNESLLFSKPIFLTCPLWGNSDCRRLSSVSNRCGLNLRISPLSPKGKGIVGKEFIVLSVFMWARSPYLRSRPSCVWGLDRVRVGVHSILIVRETICSVDHLNVRK